MLEFINNQVLNLNNLVGLATLSGIFIAFIEYKNKLLERQRQTLISLESQLKISGSWASASNEGYIGEPSEQQKLSFANPFYLIYTIENSALKDVMVQPGIIDFNEMFNEALAQYNQHISRIRDLENFRENLCLSNIDNSRIIQEKIKQEESKQPSERNYNNFWQSFNDKNIDEQKARFLVDKFYQYGYIIHYQLIGSRNSGGLKNFYHILKEEIDKQREVIQKRIFLFDIIFFFFISFLFLGMITFLKLQFKNIGQSLIFLLLIIIISLVNHYKRQRSKLCN